MRRLLAVSTTLLSIAGLTLGHSTAGAAPAQSPDAPTAAVSQGTYQPVPSTRVFDTRHRGPIGGRTAVLVPVAGAGAVPTSGVAAVVANVTVLAPSQSGSVSVYPGGTGWNGAGTVSFTARTNTQSMLTAGLGADGSITIRNNLAVGVQLVVDVTGYYLGGTPTVTGGYTGVPMTRVLNARTAPGNRPLAAHEVSTFAVAGTGAIPAGTAGAVIANITVLTPPVAGSIAVFDPETGWNGSGTVSFARGATFQTQVIGRLSSDGRLSVRNNLGSAVGVLVDVTGYFSRGRATLPGSFHGLPDTRVLDTRSNLGHPGQVPPLSDFQTLGHSVGQLPDPTQVAVIALNVTVLTPAQAGSISLYPGGSVWNGAATMSFQRGMTSQQTILVTLGPQGTYQLRNNAHVPLQLIGDVVGYYPAAPPAA